MAQSELLTWYETLARPFLERHAPERLASLDDDCSRLNRWLAAPESVTVCFLGASGIGKSTLLNALAAGGGQILPAGGIGPLTAQATEVHYSDIPAFKVLYHSRAQLWKIGFALWNREKLKSLPQDRTGASSVEQPSAWVDEIDPDVEEDAAEPTLLEQSDPGVSDVVDGYLKQAKQLITGDQFSERSLPYLIDAIRVVCGYKAQAKHDFDPNDIQRIKRLQTILKNKTPDAYERVENNDHSNFMEDLTAHAAGFLSPLIQHIVVGWPSEVLKSGVVLVDLPGVGIAQDSYRDITKRYVREKARAVIVVVDRAGPTEATIELLRTSGYWDRLVGAADDPQSDPCSMMLAVTKVDEVAAEERRNRQVPEGSPRPPKRQVFDELVGEFKTRMLAQVRDQLAKIGISDNESVHAARQQARDTLLGSLQVHPVSATEYRKLLLRDEDDTSFLSDAHQSGIPALKHSLTALAQTERDIKQANVSAVTERLGRALMNEIRIIDGQWRQQNRAAEEAERLASALEEILTPKQKEYDRRSGSFREFLEETVKAKIESLVQEARSAAETEVQRYLFRLQDAHWATLRAAVRRDGCFYGSRHINLPDDISTYFQEPMAAVWGQKLLKDIRKRTSELSADIAILVQEICEWASEHGGAQINKQMLQSQQARVAGLAAQMKQVGKEAVDELREHVKVKLTEAIRKPIKAECNRFVNAGDDIGPGVKRRILELFNQLASKATSAAQKPAIEILQLHFQSVREEITTTFAKWGDPIKETADLIVERHEQRVKRSDAQRRSRILDELDRVLTQSPIRNESPTVQSVGGGVAA
jgi:GTP-binding protein EngB required for normal cell division